MPKSISRGLTEEECLKLLVTLSDHPLGDSKDVAQRNRDTALIRMLYEGFPRVSELLRGRIGDLDLENDALFIRFPKKRYDGRLGKVVEGKQRYIFFSPTTHNILIQHLGKRPSKKMRIFQITLRQVENVINVWAQVAGIQRYEEHGGKSYKLVTPRKLREAGERHTDLGGADLDVTAEVAGHSIETKRRYYKKVSFEEARDQIRKHHPAFK